MDLSPKAWEAVDILKRKVQSTPVLVFPDFDKPFLLKTDTSKEGLGAVLSQKQGDGCYHPVTFGSRSLTPSEKNYHSSKLEFLTLKWSTTEHFKDYLTYSPFVVRRDNNPLTYVLMTPNLDATGHQWVSTLASFQFKLEFQKGGDNGTTDALSWVPISHSWETVQSLLEGVIVGAADWGEVRVSKELLEEHEHLSWEARVQVAKLAPMHIVVWAEPSRQMPPWQQATCGFVSGGTRRFQSGMPFSRSVLDQRLRQNRARCSSISAIVSSRIRVSCT